MSGNCGNQNNVYIGARYVPKIVGEWSANIAYEPLTVVLYQGTSYTSRTYVPKGIIPSENSQQYWALTGNYNAQVEQYRQEVLQFDERITDNTNNISVNTTNIQNNTNSINKIKNYSPLSNKKIVWYGDSTTQTINETVKSYVKFIEEKVENVQITNRGVSGSTLTNIVPTTNGYTLIDNATDLNNFDYIFISYLTNDNANNASLFGSDETSVEGAIKKTIENILTKAPTIKIVFIFPTFNTNLNKRVNPISLSINSRGLTIKEYNEFATKWCREYGVQSFNLFEIGNINQYNFRTCMQNENNIFVHPLSNVTEMHAELIISGIGQAFDKPTLLSQNLLSKGMFIKGNSNIITNYNTFKEKIPVQYQKGIGFISGSADTTYNGFITSKGEYFIFEGYANGAYNVYLESETSDNITIKSGGEGYFYSVMYIPEGYYKYHLVSGSGNLFCSTFSLQSYYVDDDRVMFTKDNIPVNYQQNSEYVVVDTYNQGNCSVTKDKFIVNYMQINVSKEIPTNTTILTCPFDIFIPNHTFNCINQLGEYKRLKVENGNIITVDKITNGSVLYVNEEFDLRNVYGQTY